MDSIELGGRNLLRLSAGPFEPEDMTKGGMTLLEKDVYTGYMGNQAWQIVGPWSGSGPTVRLKDIYTRLDIPKGTPMIYSVRVKFDEELQNPRNVAEIVPTLYRIYNDANGTQKNATGTRLKIADIVVGKWYTFSVPFTIPTDASDILNTTRWEINYWEGGTATYSIESLIYGSSPKLEIGNITTEWSAAPEDVETEMKDLIVSTETQYCIGSSTATPPAETDAGWTTGLIVSNINTTEYLWSRIKNTKKSGEIFYSEYSCLVQAQKEMINQVVEYLLWNDDQVAPGENASYTYSYKEKNENGEEVTISGTNKWSITKPSKNIPGYQHLWSRIHSTYKYTGATVESLVTSYSDYKVDTSWNQLFSLTDNLRADVEQILKDIQGGYVKIQNGSILIGDNEANPLHLIIMNHNGIAFFDNPEGTWPSAEKIENATSTWMIDGSLNMKDIAVTNLVASSIANQYLVLGNDNKNNADISGDLDIYDRKGHIAFETILNSTEDYIEGFKVYKYILSGTTMTPNGYIYLSREHGFREYDASGNILFGNEGGAFTSITNKTQQQIISKTESSVTYGAQMVPMKITNAGDGLTHIGIAFLKL